MTSNPNSAFRWSAISMGSKAVFAFAQLVVLSRLLEPADFGLVAITIALINILQMFSDMGVSNALIHFDNITENEIKSVFWLNISIGLVMSLFAFTLAPFLSYFYSSNQLLYLISIGGICLFINSIWQQDKVLAEKSLNLATIGKIEIISYFIGFCIAVAVALRGGGAYSVVFGFLANSISNAVLILYFLGDKSRYKFRLKFGEIRKFWRFGLSVLGVNLVNTISLQSDVFVAGAVFGSASLGYYSQPREFVLRMMFVINPIITRVSYPLLAMSKSDPSAVKRIYLQSVGMTSAINFPLFLYIAAFAPEIVIVLFGDKWVESTTLLRILAVWCALRSIGNPSGSLLIAMGETRRALISAGSVLVSLIIATLVGSKFGIEGTAISLCLYYLLLIPVFWYFLIRPVCKAGFIEYHVVIAIPFIGSIIAALVALYIANYFEGNVNRLCIGLLVGLTIYSIYSYLLNFSIFKIFRNFGT